MKHYLALIRKADFTDLYKFGHFHINGDMKIEINVPIEELHQHIEIFSALSRHANSSDNAFVYLIIHYTKDEHVVNSNDVFIEEVNNIFPLDEESKRNFEMSFDPRIRIEDPIWKDAVLELQMHQEVLACKKGAQNIMKIIGFENSDFKCEDYITDDIIEEIVKQLFFDKRPSGETSIWTYLLRYERHAFYPQNILGCFMDMVNVVCNRKVMREVDSMEIKQTAIFQLLESFREKSDIRFEDICNEIKKKAVPFVQLSKTYESRVDFIRIATLFLFLRNKYTEDFKYEKEFINSCIKFFGNDFILATYMLGIVLGHNHTYDCLYERLPLSIYKVKKTEVKTANVQDNLNDEQGQPEHPFQESSSDSDMQSEDNRQKDVLEVNGNGEDQGLMTEEEEQCKKDELDNQKDNAEAQKEEKNISEIETPQDTHLNEKVQINIEVESDANNDKNEREIGYNANSDTGSPSINEEVHSDGESPIGYENIIIVESKMNHSVVSTDGESSVGDQRPINESDASSEEPISESVSEAGVQAEAVMKSEVESDAKAETEADSKATLKKLPKLPCKMGKRKKDGSIARSPKPITVNTIEDYFFYSEKKGFVVFTDQTEGSLFSDNNF